MPLLLLAPMVGCAGVTAEPRPVQPSPNRTLARADDKKAAPADKGEPVGSVTDKDLLNAAILLISLGAIGYEAVHRLMAPEPLPGKTIAIVAAIGIVINAVTALLFMRDRENDLNVRGEDAGWHGLDPTNGIRAGEDHVTLAIGRDYADVAPIDGVIFAAGAQRLEVRVSVIPVR